ncbi:Sugar transporter, conserved site,Major facilitator superfamily domain,Major facilitator [Cinara cedri]|uniref:Sugar transporter, conserved site,Major facilitator superfamily domain,Major facilitator n=1 Tax=Cinara cedri TaxID=506608 RepID=A0A5E4MFI1_9HEMI|nr:Sugar transporter, conserved site,Major facilitator superfamily domain,Major facilitator [Cinara cedri]
MKLKLKKRIDLEEILEDYGLGLYQVTVCFILSLVVMYSSISPISYILTTSDLNYRCEIRQCEDQMKNDSLWLDIAIPLNINGERDQCKMYQFVFQNNTTGVDDKACKLNSFDKSTIKRCQKWVYDTDENTIVKDFGMECDDNKRSLAAVLNVVGQFIGIPFSGFISDKYGRKSLMIIGSMLSAIFGLLRSYSSNFSYFLLFEFLDSMFSCGVYSAAFVLGIELVSLKARVKVNALMGCFYPIGGVILGFVGYLTQDWRIMLRIVYTPALLILGCIWYVPESLQWLLMQNKIVEVALILSKVAKSNKKTLPPSIQEVLEVNPITNQDSLSLSDNFGNFVPVILFGVMTFVAGVLSLFLPETKDKELSNTVEQIELSGEVNITFEK